MVVFQTFRPDYYGHHHANAATLLKQIPGRFYFIFFLFSTKLMDTLHTCLCVVSMSQHEYDDMGGMTAVHCADVIIV